MLSNRHPSLGIAIDPKRDGAKDNAIFIEKIPDKKVWHVAVHVIDIPFFIRKGDVLDQQALANPWGKGIQRYTLFPPGPISGGIINYGNSGSLAVSISAEISEDGEFKSIGITRSHLTLQGEYTFDRVDQLLTQSKSPPTMLYEFFELAKVLVTRRSKNGGYCGYTAKLGYFDLASKNTFGTVAEMIVREIRLAFDYELAHALHNMGMPLIYRRQGQKSKSNLDSMRKRLDSYVRFSNRQEIINLSQEITSHIFLPNITWSVQPNVLYGFDLNARFQSPYRRFEDLVNLRQLLNAMALASDNYSYDEIFTLVHLIKEQIRKQNSRPFIKPKDTENCAPVLGTQTQGTKIQSPIIPQQHQVIPFIAQPISFPKAKMAISTSSSEMIQNNSRFQDLETFCSGKNLALKICEVGIENRQNKYQILVKFGDTAIIDETLKGSVPFVKKRIRQLLNSKKKLYTA